MRERAKAVTFDPCKPLLTLNASKCVTIFHLAQHFVRLGVFGPQAHLARGSFRDIWKLNSRLLPPQVLGDIDIGDWE